MTRYYFWSQEPSDSFVTIWWSFNEIKNSKWLKSSLMVGSFGFFHHRSWTQLPGSYSQIPYLSNHKEFQKLQYKRFKAIIKNLK